LHIKCLDMAADVRSIRVWFVWNLSCQFIVRILYLPQ